MGNKRKSNNNTLDAIKAFGLTYGMTDKIIEKSELSDAAKSNTVTESVSGDEAAKHFQENYVPQEGGPATAAEFLQQNPEIQPALSAERKSSFAAGGESFTSRDAAQAKARGLNTQAMADAYDRRGNPEEAMRLRQQARQGDLTELQIKGAERQERRGVQDDAYETSKLELAKQYAGNRFRSENEAALSKYNQELTTYQEALKQNPDNPAAAGIAPQKPALRAMTGVDMLHDATLMMRHDMEHGKVDPVKALQYQQIASQVKKEVGSEAFKLLHAGDIQGAVKAFEAQGDMRMPEGATVSARKGFYEVGGQKVPTNEIVVKLPNGNVQIINGLQGMDALDAADKVISNGFKGAELAIKKQELGIHGAGLALRQGEATRANERWAVEKPELEARAGDSKAQRVARQGLIEALDTGDAKKIDVAKQKAVAAGVKFDKPSLEFTTVVDQMGNAVVRTNKDTGEMDIVDRASGATKNIPAPGKSANVAFSSTKEAERAAKEGKIKAGDRVVVNGVPGTWQ